MSKKKKISKTALASMGKAEAKKGKECPECHTPMVATKVFGSAMYWICQCGYRERIKR